MAQKANTPATRKAKGRRNQQRFRDLLLRLDPGGGYGSQIMGANGTDITDPRDRLPWLYAELRKHERFPSVNAILTEMDEKGQGSWLYGLCRNRQEPVYMVDERTLEVFLVAWFELLNTYGHKIQEVIDARLKK